MKKIIFLSFLSFLSVTAVSKINAQTQAKGVPKSIINTSSKVKKYHLKNELDEMNKGALIDLYIERINVIVNRIPFIALTNKGGVTMTDLGIPRTPKNVKLLQDQRENIQIFLENNAKFEAGLAPYSDKPDLIDAIIYFESILKELKMIKE